MFFTADYHLGHTNILNYTDRGATFSTVEEMDEALIANHNDIVRRRDIIYFLGDFTFRGFKEAEQYFDRLNGIFHIIRGNHDYWAKHVGSSAPFDNVVWVKDYHEVRYSKKKIVLSHYPFAHWNRSFHGSPHFHGHSHGTCEVIPNRYDVGCDVDNRYRPFHIDELI